MKWNCFSAAAQSEFKDEAIYEQEQVYSVYSLERHLAYEPTQLVLCH